MNTISRNEINRIFDKVEVATEPGEMAAWASGDAERSVLCPTCQGEYSHIEKVVSLSDRDDRRESWALIFHGECGHRWAIEYTQHEGVTMVQTISHDIRMGYLLYKHVLRNFERTNTMNRKGLMARILPEVGLRYVCATASHRVPVSHPVQGVVSFEFGGGNRVGPGSFYAGQPGVAR